jgi:hypothetical protein
MSNHTAIRVGPSRRSFRGAPETARPRALRPEWAPAPKAETAPREWTLVSSPAFAWAMVQVLMGSEPRR